jgi:hypothetical protein
MDFRALDQARRGIIYQISENPTAIIIFRKPVVEDGFEGYVEDPNGTPVPFNIVGRISKEVRGPEGFKPNAVGLSTAGSWFLLVDWNTVIYKDDTFEARDRNWRIGPVTQIKQYGGVIAYEAPLIEAEIIEGEGT